MTTRFGRRQMLSGAIASAVVAFDPSTGRWLRRAEAQPASVPVPPLDGELVLEGDALDEAADDFGHIVHELPWAVLRPGSVEDVQRMVRFCNRHRVGIAMRGQGHSTHGQPQVEGGVVIDSRSLASIDEVGPGGARVGPGVRWLDLLVVALEQGLTPPVLTDYIELSIGGTLSVGGIGGHTQHHGMLVDNVLELEVITGRGERVTCSPKQSRVLFESVLGGLGQFGIIVGAKVALLPAPTNARVFRLFYSDLRTFTRDQRRALADGRFDYLEGQVLMQPEGGYQFMLEAAAYYTPPGAPNDAALLAGLEPDVGAPVIEEHTYFDWSNRLAPLVEQLRASGAWDLPHPWIDLFLPDHVTDAFVQRVLDDLRPEDTGGGPMLCYPFRRNRLTRPFVAVPNTSTVFLFDLLRFAPPDPAVVEALVAQNRELYERARNRGGKVYPVGSVPLSFVDWVAHFGVRFPAFAARKLLFDPNGVLTPGQRIFPSL